MPSIQLDKAPEADVTAQISVPTDGGWGWVVVAASFFSIAIQNGNTFTFGALISDMTKSLNVEMMSIALISSLQSSLFFMFSPFAAAFVNRYGFRFTATIGSVLSSFSLLIAYLSRSYLCILTFFGITHGIGLSFMNLSSLLIVGFYFEKRRALALAIATSGASVGLMIFYPEYSYLVALGGWRPVILLQAGQFGIIYFLSLTYRPLLTLTVIAINKENESAKSLKVEPNVDASTASASAQASAMERFVGEASNVKYPTAAEFIQDPVEVDTSSTETKSVAFNMEDVVIVPIVTSSIGNKQLQHVESGPAARISSIIRPPPEALIAKLEKRKWWMSCCHWEKQPAVQRPMYRDDTFYDGKMQHLSRYRKSMLIPEDERTGLEYQMAVTRVARVQDVNEKAGIFTQAFRRVLSSMLDFGKLLELRSFMIFCISAFLSYLGLLVPYLYVTNRNKAKGLDSDYFVSITALSTTISRLIYAWLSNYFSSVKLYSFALMLGGISTIISDLSYTLEFQFAYCAIFGCAVSGSYALKCVCLVDLYGLSNLTNATGLVFLFLGVGSLISAPMASYLIVHYGYSVAFNVAGVILFISGLLVVCHSIPKDRKREKH